MEDENTPRGGLLPTELKPHGGEGDGGAAAVGYGGGSPSAVESHRIAPVSLSRAARLPGAGRPVEIERETRLLL